MGLFGDVKIGKHFSTYMMTIFLATLKWSSSIFGEITSTFANMGLDTNVDSSSEVKIAIMKVRIWLLMNSGKECILTGRYVFHSHVFSLFHLSTCCVSNTMWDVDGWAPPAWRMSSGGEVRQQKLSMMNITKIAVLDSRPIKLEDAVHSFKQRKDWIRKCFWSPPKHPKHVRN